MHMNCYAIKNPGGSSSIKGYNLFLLQFLQALLFVRNRQKGLNETQQK
jgi:hypothetical protein